MNVRRIVPLTAVVVLAAGAFLPAQAATKKPFTGSYKVTLSPDPVINAYSTAGRKNCFTLNPSSVDTRSVKMPRAGRFTIVLDSAQATPVDDWDLYVLDKSGEEVGSSSGATAHEEVSGKLKKATELVISVCNLTGSPSGTVSYKLV